MPLGFAFFLYDAFSAAVQRKWTCWVARSLAGKGGLPLGFGWFMRSLLPTQIMLDKGCGQVFNVYTLNQEPIMTATETKTAKTLELVRFIKSHGHPAWLNVEGSIGVIATYTKDGAAFQARELIEEPTMENVRAWLGY